jgi:putative transposase
VPVAEIDLIMLKLIDEIYLKHPYYGVVRMTDALRAEGYSINYKRVRRLMRVMGLEAVYQKPRTSVPHPEHRVWPYLLRDVVITRANQVWTSDITFVPSRNGFWYLVAVMDWYSRFVLSWRVSASIESTFCVNALNAALAQTTPEIFNTDQGSQFTSNAFTSELLSRSIRISMDGRGRCFDNIFIERLWRTVKYEDIYLKDYETLPQLERGLDEYFDFYNNERRHQSLEKQTPAAVYFQ